MKPLNLTNIFSRAQVAIKFSSCALVAGSYVFAGVALAAPPANDNFADAILLPGNSGVQTGTNTTDATFQTGEPSLSVSATPPVKTVWFKWTCVDDGAFTINTAGSTNFDFNEWNAILGVYSGSALNALTPLSGTSVGSASPVTTPVDIGNEENLTIMATAGTTYYIQVAGYKDSNEEVPSTNIKLTWSFVATIYDAKIETFGPGAVVGAVSGNAATITRVLPYGSDLALYAPTFTLSPSATCNRISGAVPTPNFGSGPIVYTVTAKGSMPVVNNYTVTTTIADRLLWNIAAGGDWDFATTNWLKQPGDSISKFTDGNNVVFNNSAGGNINIGSAVTPGTTIVDATAGTYTFSGGPLAGAGTLTKSNSGILKLVGTNTRTGSLTVDGGTLEATGTSALGFGSSYTVATGSTLTLNGTTPEAKVWPKNLVSPAGPNSATLNGGGTVNIDLGANNDVGLNFNMSGFTGNLNLTNGATCILNVYSPTFTAPTTGSINIGTGATLYLGWLPNPFTINLKLNSGDGSFEKLGMLRGDNSQINGTIVLNTNATIGSTGPSDTITVNSVISDGSASFGFTTVASGTVILAAPNNTYTGPTVVNATSKLQCNTSGSLGSGPLAINGKVNLNYAGTRIVSSLKIGGVVKTAFGTYGTTASGATFKDDTYFISPAGSSNAGTVTLAPAVVSNYDTWLTGFTFAPGADKTTTGDPDGDGVTNQMEFAFGLNPTLGTSTNPITQQLDKVTGNFQYTRRATPAATGITYVVLTSSDLVAWTPGGATETGFTTAGDIETVTVNVTTPAVGGKLFVRVEAKPAP